MTSDAAHPSAGYPLPDAGGTAPLGASIDADFAHRTRTNTRIPLEPIGYDSEGAPLWPWQVMDGD